MTPFYFGSSSRPLFGSYHPPTARPVREVGVVLCAPVGHEYVRAHRLFRSLAITLGKSGFHVLRFDYSGCGDSSGDAQASDVRRWTEDVSTAIDELKDTAGVSRVSLVGLRLGASLAMLAASKRKDVDVIVLWDPVVQGASYLASAETLHHEFLAHEYPSPRSGPGAVSDEGVLGLLVGESLREGLTRLDLATVPSIGARRVGVIVSSDCDEYARLRDHLVSLSVPSAYLPVEAPAGWSDASRVIAAFLPQQFQPALQEVMSLLTAGNA